MGDRGNIVVQDKYGNRVYLYSHWTGSRLPEILRRALSRKQRWYDGPYLTRIIFCEMIKGHETEETGFGISSRLSDGSYALLVVDTKTQTVTIESENEKTLSFEDYIKLPEATWEILDPDQFKVDE
jgi:hypothetical protein